MLYKYEVLDEYDPDPMYGHSKSYGYFDTVDEAISKAKSVAKRINSEHVYVLEHEYTSEANMKRKFAFRSNWVWHKWITNDYPI